MQMIDALRHAVNKSEEMEYRFTNGDVENHETDFHILRSQVSQLLEVEALAQFKPLLQIALANAMAALEAFRIGAVVTSHSHTLKAVEILTSIKTLIKYI